MAIWQGKHFSVVVKWSGTWASWSYPINSMGYLNNHHKCIYRDKDELDDNLSVATTSEYEDLYNTPYGKMYL